MTVKKTFFILLATFIVPIILGSILYWINPNFSSKSVNYGQLIEPIVVLNDNEITWYKPNTLIGKWTLAYMPTHCNNRCFNNLKMIKSLHILMNDKMNRFQRVLLNTDNITQYQFIQAKTKRNLPQDTLLLIDPLGNLMMSYQMEGIVIKRVLKDLNRLLKYSRIG